MSDFPSYTPDGRDLSMPTKYSGVCPACEQDEPEECEAVESADMADVDERELPMTDEADDAYLIAATPMLLGMSQRDVLELRAALEQLQRALDDMNGHAGETK